MCKSVFKVLYRKLIRKKSDKYVISSAKTNTLEPVQLISYRIYEFDSTEVVYETPVDSNNDGKTNFTCINIDLYLFT